MDAMENLKIYKELVDNKLHKFFKERLSDVGDIDKYSSYMMEMLREYTMRGGKRVRAAIMYYSYRLFSKENLDEVIKASMAFELVQSYLLIHDDIIDQDYLRRGGMTVHKMFEHAHEKSFGLVGAEHFGASMAIIEGDIANHLANLIILNLNMPCERKVRAAVELNRVVHRVIYGQALDVLSSSKKELSEEELMKIHRLKTATYTFEGPLMVGAILAGAGSSKMKALSDYAIPLGMAFQIQDDILGLFGDEQKLGKPVGSDLREGKKTLLIIKALEKADKRQKSIIKNALGNTHITPEMVEDVQTIMITTGSLDYSRRLAKSLIKKAQNSIAKLKADPEAKEFLLGIADYMLNREY